jgi:L-Ala-D/L-Glu epimerase
MSGARRSLGVHIETWSLREPFVFAGQHWTESALLVVEIRDGEHVGVGEAYGVYYFGETAASMQAQVESVADAIIAGADRPRLQALLPCGGARNAVDCALWDLEAKLEGRCAWDRAGVPRAPATTVLTVGMKPDPAQMAAYAAAHPAFGILKVKVDADQPVERMAAIRAARPGARLLLDANQSWTFAQLRTFEPQLHDLGVEMIEQPLPRGGDAVLSEYRGRIALCADESCQDRTELDAVVGRYQMISIKLDKTGGLTEGLQLAAAARGCGLGLTIGTMPGTSRAMAAAHVLAQHAEYSDLDAPLLFRWDHAHSVCYEGDRVVVSAPGSWGLT